MISNLQLLVTYSPLYVKLHTVYLSDECFFPNRGSSIIVKIIFLYNDCLLRLAEILLVPISLETPPALVLPIVLALLTTENASSCPAFQVVVSFILNLILELLLGNKLSLVISSKLQIKTDFLYNR